MSHGKHQVIAIVVAALALFTASATAASTLEEANTRARQYVQQAMKEQRIPGLQMAVIKDNRIVLSESCGLANVENRVAASKATLPQRDEERQADPHRQCLTQSASRSTRV